jgi:hypothetical protein
MMRHLRRNDEHLGKRDSLRLYPRWQVINAIPIEGDLIKRVVVQTEKDPLLKRHLEEVYHNVDGRDEHPSNLMDPHPSLLPRGSLHLKKPSYYQCYRDHPCGDGYYCVIVDLARYGDCHQIITRPTGERLGRDLPNGL